MDLWSSGVKKMLTMLVLITYSGHAICKTLEYVKIMA
jgi:hypothetical protein